MTATENLSKTQESTLARILPTIALNGEITEYETDGMKGVYRPALEALVKKGIITRERKPFVMPVGPYAGQEMQTWHYSVA